MNGHRRRRLRAVAAMGQSGDAPPQEPTFLPSDLEDLRAWYDASQEDGYANDDPVVQLTDFSGNEHHAVQDTGSRRGTFKANVLNGRPTILMDSNDWYRVAGAADTGKAPHTIFAVVLPTATPESTTGWAFGSYNCGEGIGLNSTIGRRGSLGWYGGWGRDASWAAGSAPQALSIFTKRWESDWVTGRRNGVEELDASLVFNLSGGDIGVPGQDFDSGVLDNPHPGHYAEMIFYARALSDEEILQVESYLAIKWSGATPTGLLGATAAAGAVRLSWQDNAPLASAYLVERRAPGAGSYTLIDTLPTGSSTYLDDTPLGVGQYRVAAVIGGLAYYTSPIQVDATAAAPPWDVSDLALWLSPNFRREVAGDVSAWLDRSGLNHDVVGAAAAGTSAEMNGVECIQSDGSTHNLEGTGLGLQGASGLTVIVAGHLAPDAAVNSCFIGRDGSNNRGWSLAIDGSGRPQFLVATSSSTRALRSGSRVHLRGMPAVVRGRYNGASGELSVWVNGQADNGALDGSVPATIAHNGPNLRVLNNGFGDRMKGLLGTVLVFDRALSDAECEAIELELMARHALYQLVLVETSPDLGVYQGYTRDATHHIVSGTTVLQRRNASWSVVATNGSPLSGISGLDHIGDVTYYDGSIYAPAEDQDPPFNGHILVFDATTLARTAVHDISAEAFEPSALAVDPDRGLIWVGSFQSASDRLWRYDLDDFSYQGQLVLSRDLGAIQGLSYSPHNGYLWATTDGGTVHGALHRIDPSTGEVVTAYRRYVSTSPGNEPEGIDFTFDGQLGWMFREEPTEYVLLFDVTEHGP